MSLIGARKALLFGRRTGWVLKGDGVRADIDLDFANGRGWQGRLASPASLMTCTRAISGTGHAYDYADDINGDYIPFAANTPRITNKGLIVEDSRTNVCLYSTDLSNGFWSPNGLTSVGSFSAPDGTTSTGSLVENGLSSSHRVTTNTIAVNSTLTYAVSCFIKPANRTWFRIQVGDGGANNVAVYFNCSGSGTVGTTALAGTGVSGVGSIIAYPNGWYRVTAVIVCSTANSGNIQVTFGSASADNTSTFTGNGLEAGSVWMCQIEQAAFATSPIRTTSAAVTRNADVVTLTTLPTFGSAYTLFAQGTPFAPTSFGVSQPTISYDNGTLSQRAQLYRVAATGNDAFVMVGSSGLNQTIGTATTWTQNSSKKIIGAFAPNDHVEAFSGVLTGQDTAAGAVGGTTVHIGCRADLGSFFNGVISRVAIWPTTRVSNAGLQGLTT